MKKVIRLTESDLTKIIKMIVKENQEMEEGKVWDTIKKPFQKAGKKVKDFITSEIIYRELENGLEDYIKDRLEDEFPEDMGKFPEYYKYAVDIEPPYVIIGIYRGPDFRYNVETYELEKIDDGPNINEIDLHNIVKKFISEDINNNTLYRGIMDVLSSSNASREEKKDILKMILDEMGVADDIRSRVREPKPSYMSRLRGDGDQDRWKEFR